MPKKQSRRRPRQRAFARHAAVTQAARMAIESLEGRQMLSVPNGPYGLALTWAADSQVSLNWRLNSTDETGLRVERRLASGGAYQTVANLAHGWTTFTDMSLSRGTTYVYRVCAVNSSGISAYSNEYGVTTTGGGGGASPAAVAATGPNWATVPNGPYGLNVFASPSQVSLAWRDNADNETGFRIERRPASGSTFNVVGTVGPNTTNWIDTSISASSQYVYRIVAFNNIGDSAYSNQQWVTTGGSVATPAAQSASSSSAAAAGYFPTAVFYQPTFTFDTWKSRGINTLYGYDGFGGPTVAQWDAAAAQKGFLEIRQPSPTPGADNSVPNLIAWLTPSDEPESNGVAPSQLNQQYWALKWFNPSKPVITTYSGGHILGWQAGVSQAQYQTYMQSTDWVGADIYPVTGWNLPGNLGAVGQVVDQAQVDSANKRQFAFIETSNQNLSWVPNERAATPDEVRGEVWDAVIHGATGIVYFPRVIGGVSGAAGYDGTPWNVAQEMTAQNYRLQQYGGALLSPENPSWMGMTTTGPLEVAWRSYAGKNYFFVLNLSNQTLTNQGMSVRGVNQWATATVDGENRVVPVKAGYMTDNFKPYEMHVYVM